jgi:gamma-glutamylcyclotransferase (GGCT)/AIG2-like uncharacterized protein YtfP
MSEPEVTTLFVYGTLVVGGSLHEKWCGDRLTVEAASTTGLLYDLPYGFPALVEGGAGPVYGQAMTFPDLQATLDRLDLLEGYSPGNPQGSFYIRRVRPVTLLDSKRRVRAHCYVWRGRLPDGARHLPYGVWVPRPPE